MVLYGFPITALSIWPARLSAPMAAWVIPIFHHHTKGQCTIRYRSQPDLLFRLLIFPNLKRMHSIALPLLRRCPETCGFALSICQVQAAVSNCVVRGPAQCSCIAVSAGFLAKDKSFSFRHAQTDRAEYIATACKFGWKL